MPFKDEDFISETGNWNVAADYSREKIFKHLYYSDEYQKIARFGYSELLDELQGNFSVDKLKLHGFSRLIVSLMMLIENSEFAIKNKTDKEKLQKIYSELERIDKIQDKLFNKSYNQMNKTTQTVIIKDRYDRILERVIKLKKEINDPLNKSHLIFTDKKEFDIKSFKRNLKDRMVNKG